MDDEDLAVRRCGAERVPDRILTPLSSANNADGSRPIAQVLRRIRDELVRQRDDDFIDRRVREERVGAALEHRPAADLHELFQSRAAEAPAAPAGCKDCGDEHRAILPFCNVSTVFATTAWMRSASAFASCAVGASSGGG